MSAHAPTALATAALAAVLAACSAPAPTPVAAPASPAPAVAAPPPAAIPDPEPGTRWDYACGDLTVTVAYETQAATLTWDDHRLALPAASAASGLRYADAIGNEFWNDGQTAQLTLVGDPAPRRCGTGSAAPAAAGPATAFHASGNDPDWVADVTLDATPHLQLSTDGATIVLEALVAGEDRWSGTSPAGREIALEFERAPCTDAVSGEPFEARATLRLGDERRVGCGRFLR